MKYFALVLLLPLAACATLSESECRSANWYDIGVKDGANGRADDFILQHAKACNEHGVIPVAKPWREGRQEGLKRYCTPRNAYEVGKRGASLSPVCPAANLGMLYAANDRGKDWHRIGREISDVEREIRDINSRLADLPADDPARASLMSQRSFLRLDLLTLRTQRLRYRY